MKDYAKIFGANLEKELNSFGISQVELADRMYITNSAISGYITGKRIPRIETIVELCEMFNVSIDYMFGLISEKNHGYTYGDNLTKEIPVLKSLKYSDSIFNSKDNIEKYLTIVTRNYKNPDKLFGIRVKSDNMYPRIYPKDLLIVEQITPNNSIKSGDICIITRGNDDAVAREVTPSDNGFYFNPYNTNMPPTFYNWDSMRTHNINIVGRVVELIKNFE